jgi:farnesyl-diphosphate farnesyltransferase
LWAVGLALLTLQKINANPEFTSGAQVKVSRRAVAMTRVLTDAALRNNWLLRRLFAFAARGLPLTAIGEIRRPHPAHLVDPSPGPAQGHEPERSVRRSYGGSAT